mgnify:CR=1 FL=1
MLTDMRTPLTVTQLNTYLKMKLEEDPRLSGVLVAGEISNFTHHYKSGHLYFSLKDERSVLRAVMFARSASRLRFAPQDGMRVLARGRISCTRPPDSTSSMWTSSSRMAWERSAWLLSSSRRSCARRGFLLPSEAADPAFSGACRRDYFADRRRRTRYAHHSRPGDGHLHR